MLLMQIPTWLANRPISSDDPPELRQLFKEEGVYFFSDVSMEAVKEFYHQYPGNVFYKLIRILGFCGVQFHKKLSAYSGPLELYPEVISVSSGHDEDRLSDFLKETSWGPFFHSSGFRILKQLHGVPIESFMRLSKPPLTRNQIVSILPATITPAHDNFFVSSPIMPATYEITSDSDIPSQLQEREVNQPSAEYASVTDANNLLAKTIESLQFSARTETCLHSQNIKYVGELVTKKDDELIAIPHLGKKSYLEIKKRLFDIGLQTGLIVDKIIKTSNLPDDMNISLSPVSTLDLSVRTHNCLKAANIITISDLQKKSDQELLDIQFFGRKCLREIRTKLRHVESTLKQYLTPKFSLSPVSTLDLSVRTHNCLKAANIITISDLQKKSDQELLDIQFFGRKCLREIRTKLRHVESTRKQYLTPKFILKDGNGGELDFKSGNTIAKLCTRIGDLTLSVRSRRCLKKKNIQFVWQLAQVTESELREVRNLGRKSIDELRKMLEDSGFRLGMRFTPEQLAQINTYEHTPEPLVLSDSIKKVVRLLNHSPLAFLNDKENLVVAKRLFQGNKKQTLEELAQQFSLTRERARQIEKSAVKKIKQQHLKDLRIITESLKQAVEPVGGLTNLEFLEIDINDFAASEQLITNCLLQMVDEALFIDWEFGLVSTKGEEWILHLCETVLNNIIETVPDKFFTEHDLAKATQKAIISNGISATQCQKNLTKRFCKEKKVAGLDNLLCCGRITRQDHIILAFKEFFPEGLEVYKKQDLLVKKLKEFDPTTFCNTTPRSVLARLTNHPDVLLWGRGFFIHKDHVSYDEAVIREIEIWIETRFELGHSRFQIDVPFNKFREKLLAEDITNQYALYTLLRLQGNKRIGQRRYPTIVDFEADIDIQEGILVELENYFLTVQGPIPYLQIKDEFLVKRGWKVYSLQQNINTHSELIFPWQGNSYIHLEYMNVNYGKLDELIEALRAKLTVLQSAYSLKGAKKVMSVLWEQVCPSASVRTMIKLIRSVDPEDLQIVRHIIQFVDHSAESFTVAAELEEFFLDKGVELNSHELREEFCVQRGWSENRWYGALRKARLFRSGKSTYLHPTTIGWNESLSQEVYLLLEAHLAERNRNHYPHMQIGELIDEYVLPELPLDIQWTRQLLISVCEEMGDFLFFDDAYVAQDNSFDIEDMDDMVGYLIARNFKLGIAKKEKVEELLWREGVLESGHSLPISLFFEESSIQFRKESDEVELSPIGISRYAKKV